MRRRIQVLGVLSLLLLPVAYALAGEQVVLELTDGTKVEGELLKRDEKRAHVLVADQVLSIEMEKVKSVSGQQEEPKEVKEFKLYRTSRGTVKSVTAHTEELGPAIVVVKTPSGMGTGWFCNPNGYIVTNQHVIADEQSISVTVFERQGDRLEKKVFKKVKLIALDPDIDLALLRIEEEIGMDIPQLYIGESASLSEGDKVFTIGNPMGLERSTAEGMVSKVNRNMGGRLYVQTTAPIAPGNSGGPLFNERGEVIGVVNMGYVYLDGLGFAIPSKYVQEFLDNVEAFAFDPDNPNSGMRYMEAPVTATDGSIRFDDAEFVKPGPGVSCLTLADMDGDGVKEAVFANNNKGEIAILRLSGGAEAEEAMTDFEDINRIPDSELFKLITHAVNNSISSMVVTDWGGDGRPDIVFQGDVDGLSVVEQGEDGEFGKPRRIAKVDVSGRTDALRAADFDGDGEEELLVLGKKELFLFEKDGTQKTFPMAAAYRDKIKEFQVRDMNGDGREDLLFFVADPFYAAHSLTQDAEGNFVEAQLFPSHISGPVKPYSYGAGRQSFLTLDKGQNRIRELTIAQEDLSAEGGRINVSVQAIPIDADTNAADDFEVGDLDADGRPEVVIANKGKNEFLVLHPGADGFRISRSPAPKSVADLALLRLDEARSVLFSLSRDDKVFGVSRIDTKEVTFPRPINTEGTVEFIGIEEVDSGVPSLLWVEKLDRDYAVRAVPAADVAQQAFDGQKGSIDVEPLTLSFGEDETKLKEVLSKKPDRLAFADFNHDGINDLVIYWSFSGKESLYLGRGEGKFTSIIVEQEFLDEQKGQPLLVADIEADGTQEVLLVQPGFARVLAVDEKNKLYVERQFNWEFNAVSRLIPYEAEGAPEFLALSGSEGKLVEFDPEAGGFKLIATIELEGLGGGPLKLADADGDGETDVLMLSGNALLVACRRDQGPALKARIVFDARLEYFTYWNLFPADLDGDGADEVLLFDSKKAMFEIYRRREDGTLRPVLRHRLFERTIYQRGEGDSYELPQELAVGDMDGNGKVDLVFILQDRIAIYLQEAGVAEGAGSEGSAPL